MRIRVLIPVLALAAGAFVAGEAAAWTPPSVGQSCHGTRGGGAPLVGIAGNYLGGRPIRNGIVDWKSFQGCFRTAEQCAVWLSDKARAYPLAPSRATCVQVTRR